MNSTKAFYKSKSFWGPVVALFAMLSDMRGWGGVDQAAVLGVVDQIMTYGGVLFGFYGRVVAAEKLGLKDALPVEADLDWDDDDTWNGR